MKLTRNKDGSPKIPKGWRKMESADDLTYEDRADKGGVYWETVLASGKHRPFKTYIRRIKKGTK